jgi:hypothetical protein
MVAEQGAKEIGAATRPGADGSAARITEGGLTHYAAHAALGCATGQSSKTDSVLRSAAGVSPILSKKNLRFFLDRIGKDSPGVGNCAAGATGGVLGEMSALAYKKEHAGTMTQAELRERAGNRAAMIGAVSGAVVGEGWVY